MHTDALQIARGAKNESRSHWDMHNCLCTYKDSYTLETMSIIFRFLKIIWHNIQLKNEQMDSLYNVF